MERNIHVRLESKLTWPVGLHMAEDIIYTDIMSVQLSFLGEVGKAAYKEQSTSIFNID